jgi:hypothetical protein
MIPVEKPLLAKNGQDGRVRGPIILSLERFRDGVASDRRGRGTRLHPLRWGSSRGGEGCRLCRARTLGRSLRGLSLRGHGGNKARSCHMKCFQQVAMDLITGLPKSRGYDAIPTIVDHGCSRGAIFLPCTTTITRPQIAKLYLDNVFRWFGLPEKIISD